MTKPPALEGFETWCEGGHLSDLAVVLLADGDLAPDGERGTLPPEAHAHARQCEHCARRIGEAVFLCLIADDVLDARAARAPAAAPVDAAGPLPNYALVGALALVSLGALPRVLSRGTAELPAAALDGIAVVLKGTTTLLRGISQQDTFAAAFAWCVTAIILVAVGIAIGRLAPWDVSRGDSDAH